jgi:four helix bundle protein
MSAMQTAENAQIRKKTIELVQSLFSLTEKLPDYENHNLKRLLQNSVRAIPGTIEDTLNENGEKIKKIKKYIKAGGILAETREYLDLIHILRYGKTRDLIELLNDVNDLLKEQCRSLNFNGNEYKPNS